MPLITGRVDMAIKFVKTKDIRGFKGAEAGISTGDDIIAFESRDDGSSAVYVLDKSRSKFVKVGQKFDQMDFLGMVSENAEHISEHINPFVEIDKSIITNHEVIATLQSEISSLKSRVLSAETKLANSRTFSEYEIRYVPESGLKKGSNNGLIDIYFTKKFSKRPFVNSTLDVIDTVAKVTYDAQNVTDSGFQVSVNYIASLKGVWYEAFVFD